MQNNSTQNDRAIELIETLVDCIESISEDLLDELPKPVNQLIKKVFKAGGEIDYWKGHPTGYVFEDFMTGEFLGSKDDCLDKAVKTLIDAIADQASELRREPSSSRLERNALFSNEGVRLTSAPTLSRGLI